MNAIGANASLMLCGEVSIVSTALNIHARKLSELSNELHNLQRLVTDWGEPKNGTTASETSRDGIEPVLLLDLLVLIIIILG